MEFLIICACFRLIFLGRSIQIIQIYLRKIGRYQTPYATGFLVYIINSKLLHCHNYLCSEDDTNKFHMIPLIIHFTQEQLTQEKLRFLKHSNRVNKQLTARDIKHFLYNIFKNINEFSQYVFVTYITFPIKRKQRQKYPKLNSHHSEKKVHSSPPLTHLPITRPLFFLSTRSANRATRPITTSIFSGVYVNATFPRATVYIRAARVARKKKKNK